MTSSKYRQLAEQLLANTQDNLYAVIDGAACQPLRQQLYEMQPPYYCLWSGELAPDIQEVAPYLVKVDEHEGFFLWLLENGWEHYWNIFIDSPLPLDKLKRKLKTLQFVLSPDKQSLLFRYYDPRVLNLFLPECESSQLTTLFSGKYSFMSCHEENGDLMKFLLRDNELHVENTSVWKG